MKDRIPEQHRTEFKCLDVVVMRHGEHYDGTTWSILPKLPEDKVKLPGLCKAMKGLRHAF